jgi:hypothetical protein
MEFYEMDYKIRATESFLLGQLRDIQETLSNVELMLENAQFTDISGAKETLKGAFTKVNEVRGELSRKTGVDLEAHVKAHLGDFKESSIVESYEKYMMVNKQRLEDEFHKAKDFQTTVHGLKVRGVYSTHEQAAARAKALNKKDPYFNVYVADVGEWLPWDPSPDDVQEGEYANEELNKLMKAYKENAAKRDAFFEEEKRQKLAAAQAAVAAAKGGAGASASGGVSESKGDEMVAPSGSMFDGDDLFLARKAGGAAGK